jgi:hypothetical protein
MTENTINHDFWAEPDAHRRGWLARYSSPSFGVRVVRDGEGMVKIFCTKADAEYAASCAYRKAMDAGEEPRSLAAKVFKVSGAGKHKRAVPVSSRTPSRS